MSFTLFLAGLMLYSMWPLYVFAMAMLRAQSEGKVHPLAWILAFPVVFTAVALDVILNYTLFIILLWDIPVCKWRGFDFRFDGCLPRFQFPLSGEWTISQRLNRITKQDSVKGRFWRWFAENFLDPYDHTGKHIG